ncbi:protein tweety homolog 3 isoform X1 [Nematostella vectensis]|uniref:protein tweety homolog 3 isoform X1 n=1 Tax=Nematostella vectensis TaxID=45351 RepID=UPI00207790E7|nr:protein tweety homolog 3 isoform X1 [Nematostella vectensis]
MSKMAGDYCLQEKIPSSLATFYHFLPRANFYFLNTSSTFAPTEDEYQQSLVLYGSAIVVIGSVVSFLLFIHFLVFCAATCCRRPVIRKRPKRLAILAILFCLSTLVCSACLIAAYVFNDKVEQGVNSVTIAIGNVNSTLVDSQMQVASIQNIMVDIRQTVESIKMLPNIPKEGRLALANIETFTITIIDTVGKIKPTTLPDINIYITNAECYRWWTSFGIVSLSALNCLLALYSLLRKCKTGFSIFTMLGTLAYFLNWALIGLQLVASIAMSDLCYDPRRTIDFYLSNKVLPIRNIANYYIDCKKSSDHPYKKFADTAMLELASAEQVVEWLILQVWLPTSSAQQLTTQINSTKTSLDKIETDLKCSAVKQQYDDARCAVCYPVVEGLSQLLLMAMIVSLFLGIVLSLITPIYNKIPHRKPRGQNVFEMCAGRVTSPETPYQSVSVDENSPLVPTAPPPEYQSCPNRDFQFHSCQEDMGPQIPRIPPPRGTHSQPTKEITNVAL